MRHLNPNRLEWRAWLNGSEVLVKKWCKVLYQVETSYGKVVSYSIKEIRINELYDNIAEFKLCLFDEIGPLNASLFPGRVQGRTKDERPISLDMRTNEVSEDGDNKPTYIQSVNVYFQEYYYNREMASAQTAGLNIEDKNKS